MDIIIILVLAALAFLGWRRGIIRVVLLLAGLILGVFLAGRYYASLSGWLSFIPSITAARITAFIIILLAVIAAAFVVAFLLRRTLALVRLGWADRFLGALFGFLAGAVVCGVLLTLLTHFIDIEGTVSQSWIASLLLDRIPVLLALLPQEFDSVRSIFQ